MPLPIRSEEHTSELQSHDNLVCRLLLEKKNAVQSRRGRGGIVLAAAPRVAPRLLGLPVPGAACDPAPVAAPSPTAPNAFFLMLRRPPMSSISAPPLESS